MNNNKVTIVASMLLLLLFALSPAVAQTFDQEGLEIAGDFPKIISFKTIDFDDDGDQDIFLTCETNQGSGFRYCELYYLENTGEYQFNVHPLITQNDDNWEGTWIRHIECVDFDGDGDLDIIISGGVGEEGWRTITIMFHEGNLEFTTYAFQFGEEHPFFPIMVPIFPHKVRCVDFDDNGLLDMIVAYHGPDQLGTGLFWGALYAYMQTDSLEFSPVVLDEWKSDGGWTNLETIQLVEDGEVVVFAESPLWMPFLFGWMDAKVLWRWEQDEFVMTPLPLGDYEELRWCDWDLDGRLDYLAYGYPPSDTLQAPPREDSSRVRLFLQNDEGEFEHYPLTPGLYPNLQSLEIADFNGNGRPDVFFCSPGYNINEPSIIFNNPEGSQMIGVLPDHRDYTTYHFQSADLNGDGRVDLVASFWQTVDDEPRGYLTVFENLGPASKPEDHIVASPKSFELLSVSPNPFNSQARLNYGLPNASSVKVKVFDTSGREVADLVNAHQTAGSYSVVWDASSFSSGIYLVQMQAGSYRLVRKVVLTR